MLQRWDTAPLAALAAGIPPLFPFTLKFFWELALLTLPGAIKEIKDGASAG